MSVGDWILMFSGYVVVSSSSVKMSKKEECVALKHWNLVTHGYSIVSQKNGILSYNGLEI